MKISKLFHWLYGLVMLLPIFAIGVTCGYAMFNKNAYQSYGDNYVDKSITIETQAISNTYYLQGQVCTWYQNDSTYSSQSGQFGFSDISLNLNQLLGTEDVQYKAFRFYTHSSNFMLFYDSNGLSHSLNNYKDKFSNFTYTIDLTEYATKPYNTTYGNFIINILVNAPLSNVFYYSVDRVTQSNMFSWAYNSFLVAPFAYIVNLFSMPINSPVVMLLSYWLTISVIWLVFDLIMYVPLLAHRWLDKGMVE